MSIASQLTDLQNNITAAYGSASDKGATMPAKQSAANLASTIASITGADISDFFGATKIVAGSFTGNSQNSYTITHDLGITPKLIVYVMDGYLSTGPTIAAATGTAFAPASGADPIQSFAGYDTDSSVAAQGSTEDMGNPYATCAVAGATITQATLLAGSGVFVPGATYRWIALG